MHHSSSESRISYSFPESTFDLEALCPRHVFEADGGSALAVQLDGRWPRLFRHLHELDLILACAGHGPVSMASAWAAPQFDGYPGSGTWLCLDSGAELTPSALGGGMAVIEQGATGQQLASIQFFDRDGQGCLKLLLTNGSDLDAFESLVRAHACGRKMTQFGLKPRASCRSESVPDTVMVRAVWDGLSRSLPDSSFPGLEGVSRHDALVAVGQDKAWRLPRWVVRQTLQSMIEHAVPLGGAVRNEAVFLPAGFWPTHSGGVLLRCHAFWRDLSVHFARQPGRR
ncbi:MAG: hypothetical protein V4662_11655 [Verrucomicrobiota bacterium]